MIRPLKQPFVIAAQANPRFGRPSMSEVIRAESNPVYHGYNRVIGGDRGDLLFDGYMVFRGDTMLTDPAVWTEEQLTDDEVTDLARQIFNESFASIGIETVEHS